MKTITTKDGFKWLNVTEYDDNFLQQQMSIGNLYIFYPDDESEALVNDMIELSEAIENEYILVIEIK